MVHSLSHQSVPLSHCLVSDRHFAHLQRGAKTLEFRKPSHIFGSMQNAELSRGCPDCRQYFSTEMLHLAWRSTFSEVPENRRERNTSGKSVEYTAGAAPVLRRQALSSSLLLLAIPSIALPAFGEEINGTEDGFKLYKDETDNYSLLVPTEWTKGEGKAGVRKVTAFFPSGNTSANVNVVITALGADYTKLGSFGTAEGFAETLVNSLDRGWTKPPGQAAKLLNSRGTKDYYFVEYTIQRPGERKRHLVSSVGIGFNGWYNRLFTVTGQFWEDEAQTYRSQVQKAVNSFKIS